MEAQLITNINLHLHNFKYHTEELTLSRLGKYRKKLLPIVENPQQEHYKEAKRLFEEIGEIRQIFLRLRKEKGKFSKRIESETINLLKTKTKKKRYQKRKD